MTPNWPMLRAWWHSRWCFATVTELRLLVAVTVRPDRSESQQTFASTLGRLSEQSGQPVVELGPLDSGEVQALTRVLLGQFPDPGLAQFLWEQSRGNPLFAREALLSLQGEGRLRKTQDRWLMDGDTPPMFTNRRNTLLYRVFQQDAGARHLATAMSALRRVRLDDLSLLCELTGLRPHPLQHAFDRLVQGRILVRAPGDWYEFTHPFVAECLYEDIGPAERRRLHKRISRYLEKSPGRPSGVLERAVHTAEAASPGDEAAVATLLEAAMVTRTSAPLSSAGWYEKAARLLGESNEDKVAVIRARQAVELWKASRPEAASSTGLLALTGLPAGRGRDRTLSTVVNALYSMGDWEAALSLITTEPEATVRSTPLLAQRALITAELGRGQEADELAPRAWAAVPGLALGDRVVALTFLGHLGNELGQFGKVTNACGELVALAGDLPVEGRIAALESAAYILGVAGCRSRAAALLATASQLSERAGWRDLGGQYLYAAGMVRALGGDWPGAMADLAAAACDLEFAQLRSNAVWVRLLQANLLIGAGEFAQGASLLGELSPCGWLQAAMRRAYVAELRASPDELSGARAELGLAFEEAVQARNPVMAAHVLERMATASLAEEGHCSVLAAPLRRLRELVGADASPSMCFATGWVLAMALRRPGPAARSLALAQREGSSFPGGTLPVRPGGLGLRPGR